MLLSENYTTGLQVFLITATVGAQPNVESLKLIALLSE